VVVFEEATFATAGELPPQPETTTASDASPANATVESAHLMSVGAT
jgi:hypothetical protein